MPVVTNNNASNETMQMIGKRADGSIRQLLLQDMNGNVLSRSFFPAGTFVGEEGWESKRKYHWIDAFTDDELLDPVNELSFTPDLIKTLREEALQANTNKEMVIVNIEDYKIS